MIQVIQRYVVSSGFEGDLGTKRNESVFLLQCDMVSLGTEDDLCAKWTSDIV